MEPVVISVREAARITSLSEMQIRKMVAEGKINVFKSPVRKVLIDRRSLFAYLNIPEEQVLEKRITR